MKSRDLMGLLMGSVALLYALSPDLLDSLSHGIQSFRDSLLFGAVAPRPRQAPTHTLHRPVWLAILGAFLIVIALVDSFVR